MDKVYRKNKKTTIQLTSLLDLLFVMIFVSLIQQKNIVSEPAPVPTKKVIKPQVQKVIEIKKAKKVSKPVVPQKTIFNISAEFNFYATDGNSSVPNGKYLMRGHYNKKTGQLQLGGIAWVVRPKDYDMVPLSGKLNLDENLFTGRIEATGCRTFTLSRKIKSDKSPISGKWVGVYNCSQGDTGLTLSID